jgi:molybdopterin synthase catalytic subunit
MHSINPAYAPHNSLQLALQRNAARQTQRSIGNYVAYVGFIKRMHQTVRVDGLTLMVAEKVTGKVRRFNSGAFS